jgi:SAM-dependent methyltransferase
MFKDEISANRKRWDAVVAVHARSRFYDLPSFRAGRSSLLPIEEEELIDVSGRSLLHLQCHFGMDTLSWARKGARVTGVDFSGEAIALARSLASELHIDARFIESDLYDLPAKLDARFDIVFTSYGAICWLPDLTRWARIVASCLKEGGTFYMVEGHPFSEMLDDHSETPRLNTPYFHDGRPIRYDSAETYTDADGPVEVTTSYAWVHTMADIISSLAGAGLRIEFVHEFDCCFFPRLPGMVRGEDGLWRTTGDGPSFPLTFSLRATR